MVACSDSGGFIHDKKGLDLALIKQLKEVERRRIEEYVSHHKHAHYFAKGNLWEIPCDVALPCATQNELNGKDAIALVKNGCIAVAEGANMPTTPKACAFFSTRGSPLARARPPMPAAWRPQRWRCNKTPAVIFGTSNSPKKSWPGS